MGTQRGWGGWGGSQRSGEQELPQGLVSSLYESLSDITRYRT